MNNNRLNQQSNISQESQQPQPTPQPSLQPEIPQKQGLPTWAIIMIVIGVIVVLAGASYGVYWYFTSQPDEPLPIDQGEIGPDQLPTGEPADETTDWQIYQDEEYGFEVRYPLLWQVKQVNIDGGIIFEFNNEEKDYNLEMGPVVPIAISIRDDIYDSSIDKYLTNEQIKKILKDETVLIGGKKAYIIQGVTPPVYHDFRIIFEKDKVFNFNSNAYTVKAVNQNDFNEVDKVFNQILSTFKFID